MSDESNVYIGVGRDFAGHSSVNHSADEYVRLGGFAHVNAAESFFSILKRGVYGTFHSVSEQHLQRYVNEFAFRWNHRVKLGFSDTSAPMLPSKALKESASPIGGLTQSNKRNKPPER